VSGLSISLSYGDTYEAATMVEVAGSAPGTWIEDCDIFSAMDDESQSWSAEEWTNLPGTGINVRAPGVTLLGNRLRNVGYGIAINYDAPDAIVSHNHIQNFSRDGLRGIGDNGLFEYNVVLDAYDVDDHHDDFFQSWSYEDGEVGTTVVRGVVLRGNTFINFTDPDRPFAGTAQGIGCFDGFFEDWVVENNLVIVNHWHGITFLGARNMRIVNNTVVDNRPGEDPGPPWIDVSAHKDSRASSNILIRNNLVQTITLEADDSTEDHNLLFDDPSELFVDAAGFDLRLLPTAAAIDAGSSEEAPSLDLDRIERPQGEGIDLGAFEWHGENVAPEGGAGAPGSLPPIAGDGGGDGDGDESGAAGGSNGEVDEAGGCSCQSAQVRGKGGANLALCFAALLLGGGWFRRREGSLESNPRRCSGRLP
jgi:hypothetical protein